MSISDNAWLRAVARQCRVLAALEMAIGQRKPINVIHHSDQGTQYTSLAFGGRCREAGVRHGGRIGPPVAVRRHLAVGVPRSGGVGAECDSARARLFECHAADGEGLRLKISRPQNCGTVSRRACNQIERNRFQIIANYSMSSPLRLSS
jgi:hypothetical protein